MKSLKAWKHITESSGFKAKQIKEILVDGMLPEKLGFSIKKAIAYTPSQTRLSMFE